MSPDDDKKPDEIVQIPADDGLDVDVAEKAGEKPAEKPADKAEDREGPDPRETALEDLKRQLRQSEIAAQQERSAREQAERFARQQASHAQSAEFQAEHANLRTMVNAIDATEQIAAAAERAYADAMQAGDYAQAAKAQRAMAQAESQLLRLNEGKSSIEGRLERAKQEAQNAPQRPPIQQVQPQRDPVEELAANLTPKSADWLRNHPDAAKNVQKLTAAHTAAVQLEGLEVESPEYFAFIEGKMGFSEQNPAKNAEKPQKTSGKPATPSLAVSGGGSVGGGARGSGGNSMHLSAQEVEVALLTNPDLPREKALQEYARNKQELIRLGKMSA